MIHPMIFIFHKFATRHASLAFHFQPFTRSTYITRNFPLQQTSAPSQSLIFFPFNIHCIKNIPIGIGR